MRNSATALLLTSLVTTWGCGSSDNSSGEGNERNATSSGGADATGGGVASGGTDAMGGAEATGGADATGGAEATGGTDPGLDCVDMDGDTFGVNCDAGPDSCDDDPNNWTQFGCDNCPADDDSHIDCDENKDAFITQWSCDQAESEKTVVLPLNPDGVHSFTVDWGDGSPRATIDSWDSPEGEHTYATDGPHAIRIEGEIEGWDTWTIDSGTCDLIELTKWGPFRFGVGSQGWGSSTFFNSQRLKIVATDVPDLTGTMSLAFAFDSCISIDTIPSIEHWDVSQVTDMSGMFSSNESPAGNAFNDDISGWDVSSVTDMSHMFRNTKNFNQDLSNWNVSNVTDMAWMFQQTDSFNGNISSWDVSNVTDMEGMFSSASAFNGELSNWDVSNVTDMKAMFSVAESFNQDLSAWDVSMVEIMDSMFYEASAFDQDLSAWDVSSVTIWDEFATYSGMSDANKDKLRAAGWPNEAF